MDLQIGRRRHTLHGKARDGTVCVQIRDDIVKLSPIRPLTLVQVHAGANLHLACRLAWAVLVASLGILGALRSWLPDCGLPSGYYCAVLFGLTLQVLVILHFNGPVASTPSPSIAHVRNFCRRDSRAVYLLLFGLVGLHQIGALLNGASVSGTAGDLKGYFAGGVCALLLIRCSGLFWLRASRLRDG
jgi:hypothetical protein